MFTVYYANQLESQKTLLVNILKKDPNPNPFEQETILVQSIGMAQWLQIQIAEELGITGNIQFPYPTSFLWQQYRLLFPELPKENIFERSVMVWRLMRLIPECLSQPEFLPLKHYLKEQNQLKLYQLSNKIADLFDQYLVYRPNWLIEWENNNLIKVKNEIMNSISFKNKNEDDIFSTLKWQSILWNKLLDDIKKEDNSIIFQTSHRAYLQQRYFDKLNQLTDEERKKLPKRLFIFGLSSLPITQFNVLHKLSEFCHIHLFFTNPSQDYWGNDQDRHTIEKLALKQRITQEEARNLLETQANPLLISWGKQGKEFLNLLIENNIKDIDYYTKFTNNHLLNKIKNNILSVNSPIEFNIDNSIQIHACHSKLREIEVLHNYLLNLFEQHSELSPKDIIVMSADIDSYAPYIDAIFSRYLKKDNNGKIDNRYIPYSLSDQKISKINPIINSFLKLLSLKENPFNAEDILDFLNVDSIREKYNLSLEQLNKLRHWVKASGIRFGLNTQQSNWENFNAWQNGLNRLLLGHCLKMENNAWQNIIAFDESYGINAEISGLITKFIENLTAWFNFIQTAHNNEDWKLALITLVETFYQDNSENSEIILILNNTIETVTEHIQHAKFDTEISIDILQTLFEQHFDNQRNNLNFLIGKVNFCTLLPMRAIPFKVVCLLGMNEGEFPRQQQINHFDLMYYAPQKGDRARRDDDRYLFLEALLSAKDYFYISYIGQSLHTNEKKMPSVLVNELIDYINSKLNGNQIETIYHPMTAFSLKNFTEHLFSYDTEWLDTKQNKVNSTEFLTEIHNTYDNPEINISNLINYIENPAKFFFNHYLGIYYRDHNDLIAETEHFTLSNLDKYILLDNLLELTDNEFDNFFTNETLKGNLPVNYFGKIAKNKLRKTIELFQEPLYSFFTKEKETIEINYTLNIKGKEFHLIGNIPNYFNLDIIAWRVGDVKDKYIITYWIYYLLLILTDTPFNDLRYYYKDKKCVKYFTFSKIEKEEALLLLKEYIQDYLDSASTLKLAITEHIHDYLNPKKERLPDAEHCEKVLSELKCDYVKRILSQTNTLDYAEIHQRTKVWFDKMIELINHQ